MENLTKDSSVYNAYSKFITFTRNKYGIEINNGYLPFQKLNINSAVYSLIDTHPNCQAHKIFAKWLIEDKSSIK